MTLVYPAKGLHEITLMAEHSFTRGGYEAAVHDIYIHAYVEASIVERERIRLEGAAHDAE